MKLHRIAAMAALPLLASLACPVFVGAQANDIPRHGPAIVLFDGHDLTQFDSFLPATGLNSDPGRVFTVEKGTIHISGREMGYLITKNDYKNYYLRAQFKWGEGTFGERHGMARDSGILYNIQGPNKLWPRSIEFQINEGCTGDFWLVDGAALTTRDGVRHVGPVGSQVKVDRFNKGPFKNVTGYRDPTGEVEKPHGKWNTIELVNQDGRLRQYVNGKLVNEGSSAFPSSGKILLQSESAEVFFRKIKLFPLK